MKVCFVTTSFPAYQGDIQSPFIYELAKHLVKQNVDLTVVCPNYKKSKAKNEVMEGILVRRFSYFPKVLQTLTEKGRIADFRKNVWSLFQLPWFLTAMIWKTCRESKEVDLIHCQWALSGIAGVIAKKLRRKPLVVTLRGEDLKAITNPLMRPVFKWVINNADYCTSNNEFHMNQIKHLAKQTRVIRNGVNTAVFKIRPKQAMRKKLNLPQNKTLVLFIGWLVERKGIHYLLDAIPEVIKKHKEVEFLLIGEGHLYESLVQKTQQHNIEAYVRFLGKKSQQQVAEYMSAADILVLPSLYEGMPNVVMEAFASGLPVIATDVCGTSELVQHKVNGLLIQPKKPQEIAQSLLTFLQNKQLTNKYAKAAQQTIQKQHLTWEKCAESHIKLYKEFLR
ncbi:glycosyltransferase family 4 protein [Candidatus Woesearchaeota archaeon]|nr:glycosyltransferase family 4 protein [Candidatus Woesearchaeota archaeon]